MMAADGQGPCGRDFQKTQYSLFAFFLGFLSEHVALPGRCHHVAMSGQKDMSGSIVGTFHFPLRG